MAGTICGQCGAQYGNDMDCAIHEERRHGIPNRFKKKLVEPIERNSTPQTDLEKTAVPQSESEKFFAKASILLDHIENGDVIIKCEYDTSIHRNNFRVVITPKEVGE